MSYRKRKQRKRMKTVKNTELVITPDGEEKYINGVRVGSLEITPEVPVYLSCLLYTSPSPRDRQKSRMPSSA